MNSLSTSVILQTTCTLSKPPSPFTMRTFSKPPSPKKSTYLLQPSFTTDQSIPSPNLLHPENVYTVPASLTPDINAYPLCTSLTPVNAYHFKSPLPRYNAYPLQTSDQPPPPLPGAMTSTSSFPFIKSRTQTQSISVPPPYKHSSSARPVPVKFFRKGQCCWPA
eukprot:jgi/Botrbrau1/1334/Bobra.0063s0046.1